jgi:excisionase family DNA binding protein
MDETRTIQNENQQDGQPLDINEAAAFLRLKVNYVYQLVHGRKLPAFKPGGKKLYFKKCDLEAYAFRNRQMTDHEAREMADNILTANMMA